MASHSGRHIFMFCNLQTNQVLYTFRQRLKDGDLKQLQFIGKKSVPQNIRPDLWKPLCTVTFPSSAQGQHAFKILRELRYLHEVNWDHHNPEWIHKPKTERIKLIMDQKANSVADLSKVLYMQAEHGEKKAAMNEKQKEEIDRVIRKKWAQMEALAQRVSEGEVTRIETDLARLAEHFARRKLKERTRITKAITNLRRRRQKLLWAQREIEKHDEAEKTITSAEKYRAAQNGSKALANPVIRTLLPRDLRARILPPFTLEGLHIQWADAADAHFAEKWPESVTHNVMGPVDRIPNAPNGQPNPWPLTQEEQEQMEETTLDEDAPVEEEEGKEGEQEKEEEEKKGLFKRLFSFRKRGSSAQAFA